MVFSAAAGIVVFRVTKVCLINLAYTPQLHGYWLLNTSEHPTDTCWSWVWELNIEICNQVEIQVLWYVSPS